MYNASIEELPGIGGKGSGRTKPTELPTSKHTITLTDELWERLEKIAPSERKVSETIEDLLRVHLGIPLNNKT